MIPRFFLVSFRPFLAASLLLAVGCGGSSGDDTDTTSNSGGTSAAGAAGTAGTPGTAGSGGGGASGAAPVDTSCASGKIAVTGTLDGAPVAVAQEYSSSSGGNYPDGSWRLLLGTPASVYLFGQTPLPDAGTTTGTGLVQLAGEGGDGAWYCSAKATVTTGLGSGYGRSFSLAEVAKLGACPGTPVEGSVSGCFGGPGCETGTGIEGSVEGKSLGDKNGVLASSSGIQSGTGKPEPVSVQIDYGQGKALLELSVLEGKASGLLLVPGEDGATQVVYCVGEKSTIGIASDATTFNATNLSRLGTCPSAPGTGTLEVCAY